MALANTERRTQEARTGATRSALIRAAIASINEVGLERTTMAAVAERAGLSRGAHLHHFRTRSGLLAAAIEWLSWEWVRQFEPVLDELGTGPERDLEGLDLLRQVFSGDLFAAIVTVALAARNDPELAESMLSIEHEQRRGVLLLGRQIFARSERDPSMDSMIAFTLSTLRGLAILPLFEPAGDGGAAQWPGIRDRLARLFAVEREACDWATGQR